MTPLKSGIVGAVIATGAWVAVQQYTGEPGSHTAADAAAASAAESSLREQIERFRRENGQLRADAAAALAARRAAEDALARRKADAAAAENAAAGGARGTGEVSPLLRLQVLADLQEGRVISATVRTLTRNGKLDDAFASLFDLTPAERESLQAALDQARENLGRLELANATMQQTPDGKYVIQVKPFANEGGQVYNALLDSFATTLGSERNRAFLSLASQGLERALGGMGAQERTVTVGPDAKTGNGYDVEDKQITPDSVSRNTTDEKTRASLDLRLGVLRQLLPPEF